MSPDGADIRALRKARGLTLAQLAGKLDRSIGWLSQVERDRSNLTPRDLERLSQILDAPVSLLSPRGDERERRRITRADTRRPLGERVPGMVEHLLSPDLTDGFEVIHARFAAGSRRSDFVRRRTTEIIHVLEGRLDFDIDDHIHTIGPGDTLRLRGEAYRWINPYDIEAVTVWIITPAVYAQHST